MAKGMFVVPDEKELRNPDDFGIKYPIPTPSSIARKIHKVKYWSKKVKRFFMFLVQVVFKYEILAIRFNAFTHDSELL